MFTGIVTDLGEIIALENTGDLRARIRCGYDMGTVEIGASIAHAGVCLTVIATGADWYDVQISAETVSKTNLGGWTVGKRINLERALKVGDAEITALRDEGESTRFSFRAPEALAKYIAPKGSVALDGASLTVNEVDGCSFGINIIPHTKAVTTFGTARVGDKVNLEIDTLARYVARLTEWKA